MEKPFFYFEQHFIKGNSFESFEHLCQELAHFEEQLDLKVHPTTQERPIDRFELEKAHLTPLPSVRFISSRELFRYVSWDGIVSFGSSRYSVPSDCDGKDVWVRTSQGRYLEIYDQRGSLIFRHALSSKKGATIMKEEHYEKLKKNGFRTRIALEKEFMEKFPDQRDFLEKLYVQQKLNPVFHLKPIVALAGLYPREIMLKVFVLAHQYNTFSCHFIRGLMEMEPPLEAAPETKAGTLRSFPAIKVKADLGAYQKLIEVK